MEADSAKARSDQEQALGALEQRIERGRDGGPGGDQSRRRPAARRPRQPAPGRGPDAAPRAAEPRRPPTDRRPADPGEDAYSEGFQLWQAGQYDDAITSLRAFTAAYPKHRRASYANNLVGRALLDKGDAARRGRGAARQLPQQPARASARPTASIISARR